ncbi:hypothetical protein HNP52_003657 [Sphingomonas kyeonggiensis]|uniref:Uncharacterized protein n=1 Tax=Sphingomonas kyeonggiensis TaxID=1268553 RepID=A0A7W7K565_9SPHN|nr:hypothetical protein [Sphingomonas kyeonggiensis]MBB4840565.1 hypothetical protein [Sphingomonas kyeonggiensis]
MPRPGLRDLAASLMLLLGLAALSPFLFLLGTTIVSGIDPYEGMFFLLLFASSAAGGALLVGSAWVYTSSLRAKL